MFGLRSGSEILCTISISPTFSSKNSAVFSVASILNPSCLSLAMILGRLELFAVLVLFIPSFWRKY